LEVITFYVDSERQTKVLAVPRSGTDKVDVRRRTDVGGILENFSAYTILTALKKINTAISSAASKGKGPAKKFFLKAIWIEVPVADPKVSDS
jgi:hypothetical protein